MGSNGSRIRFQTNGGGNPNLNDIFSMFGGGAGGPGAGSAYERYGTDDYEQPQPENGEDRNSKIRLTFRQAVKGATVSLSADGKKFKTHIPAGVHDGQKIRLTGKGKPGSNGGKNGDLYLHITVAEDPKFTLRGRDIIMPLPITVSQAVNGAKVTAKDIDATKSPSKCPPARPAARKCASQARAWPIRTRTAIWSAVWRSAFRSIRTSLPSMPRRNSTRRAVTSPTSSFGSADRHGTLIADFPSLPSARRTADQAAV